MHQMEGCPEFRGAALFWEILFESAGNRVLQVFAHSLLLNAMNALESRQDDLSAEWYSDMVACDRDVLHALRHDDDESARHAVADWPDQAFDFQ